MFIVYYTIIGVAIGNCLVVAFVSTVMKICYDNALCYCVMSPTP